MPVSKNIIKVLYFNIFNFNTLIERFLLSLSVLIIKKQKTKTIHFNLLHYSLHNATVVFYEKNKQTIIYRPFTVLDKSLFKININYDAFLQS